MAAQAPKVSFLLRSWNEKPDIVGSSFMALIGFGFGAAALCLYDKRDVDNRKYKIRYTVYRPDDPRVARVKKHSGIDD